MRSSANSPPPACCGRWCSPAPRAAVVLIYLRLHMKAYSPALAEARLQALQARIRPHFLFNSLNAVLALIRRDPRRAERTLEDLVGPVPRPDVRRAQPGAARRRDRAGRALRRDRAAAPGRAAAHVLGTRQRADGRDAAAAGAAAAAGERDLPRRGAGHRHRRRDGAHRAPRRPGAGAQSRIPGMRRAPAAGRATAWRSTTSASA